MTESESWLHRYEQTLADVNLPFVYWAAVPMVVVGTVGLLWTLPVPGEFYAISPLLNWGSAFLMVSAIYYFIISVPLAIGMLPFLLGVAACHVWLGQSDYSAVRVATGLFAGGALGLWLGHANRRSLLPLLQDLQHMMIGPAWVLSVLYRRVGIPI